MKGNCMNTYCVKRKVNYGADRFGNPIESGWESHYVEGESVAQVRKRLEGMSKADDALGCGSAVTVIGEISLVK